MVVDLIGIYGLKGPYCTLTTTNWFLQALSVIPRGSCGDVARRFTMIRWASPEFRRRRRRFSRRKVVSGQLDEENPFVQNSSVLLVQADEGVSVLVVDRIGDIYRSLPRRADVIVTTVGARHKCQQDGCCALPWMLLCAYVMAVVCLAAMFMHTRIFHIAFIFCCSHCFVFRCIAVVSYQDARASGNTALSSPCWDLLATMRRVVNYHSSWARQRQVELFDASAMFEFLGSLVGCSLQLLSGVSCIASAFYLMHSFCYFSCSPYWGLTPCPSGAWLFSLFVLLSGNPGFTAGRGFNPAGGAPGGG
ncbi:hypothetical protein F511_28305 [Dorcoceras hygrometricum]|uniref:Uncharacterized protein n=1 Tax=Dorcoceras hygrometricum TaxID=472368 RepID=A0A2Z7AKG1_9LAMI|nr:hypothetical protein F511_28305 [Dorcoceras hygrometricum]